MSEKENTATFNVPLQTEMREIQIREGDRKRKRIIIVDGVELPPSERRSFGNGGEGFNLEKINHIVLRLFVFLNADNVITLLVNNMSLADYMETYNRRYCCWQTRVSGVKHTVVLEKELLNVWLNGVNHPSYGDFIDCGNVINFNIEAVPCKIVTRAVGREENANARNMVSSLYVNGAFVRPANQ